MPSIVCTQDTFPPPLLRYNWHITLCKLKVYSVLIWCIYILQNDNHHCMSYRIHPVELLPFLFCGEDIFKSYSLSKFQVYKAVLLAIITMLHIRSPELVNFTTRSLLYELVVWTMNKFIVHYLPTPPTTLVTTILFCLSEPDF